MVRAKGFTLLEVLISAVLIIIGVGSIGLTVVSLRRFFKDSEDRSRAMRLASSKIEEFLVKGYSYWDESSPLSDNEDGFSWSLKVSAETASGSIANIPYKKAEAVVSYTADKGRGGINSIKNIRLTNIIAYPMPHSMTITARGGAEVPWAQTKVSDDYAKECLSGGCDCYDSCLSTETDCERCAPFTTDKVVGPDDDSKYLRLAGLKWSAKKNIKVTYSISLHIKDENTPSKIRPVDTVYTACFLDDKQYGAVTRTPLRSQPSFSNLLALDDVGKDEEHTIEVRWYYSNSYLDEDGDVQDFAYDSSVKISLNEAILTILAEEPPRA